MGPGLITRVQRLLNQQGAHTGTVDKEITFYVLAVVQLKGFDVAIPGIGFDRGNFSLLTLYFPT